MPVSTAERAWLGIGLNSLVQAAIPLLLLTAHVRETLSMDVSGLRRHALDEIRRFEEQARAAGVSSQVVLSARYVLCAGLDEAVLSTPWGHQSEWGQHPLLVALHQQAWGGEKFFDMLDAMSQDPARHIDIMELQYLCLAFGFAGKYHIEERGQEHLQEVQHDLYRKIRAYRGQGEPGLSLRWRGIEDRRNPLFRYVPWWIVAAAALPILAITFTAYYANLASMAAPLHEELAKVGVGDSSPPQPVVPAAGPTLKQLLAADERSGALSVDEEGNRTTVTLLAQNLFPSGSADVNPAYRDAIERVAIALNKVPGRVMVVGHTDDQPIKSFRYRDNFELSRERAASVVALLQQRIDNRARLTVNGVGSSQPRYVPASQPENRARNRRVEIVHTRGT